MTPTLQKTAATAFAPVVLLILTTLSLLSVASFADTTPTSSAPADVTPAAAPSDATPAKTESAASNATRVLSGKIQMSVSKNYQVGPGDVLAVNVYGQSDLTQENILVRSDGMASFNGVGELDVNGKTVSEIADSLKGALSELVIDPVISISVTRTRPATIYLAGAVMKPGMFQVTTNPGLGSIETNDGIKRFDLKISNVLSHAGGVRMDADLSRVEIQNPESGKKTVVNLWRLIKEGDSQEDVWLQSGDTIFVPSLDNQMAIHDEDYVALLRSPVGPQTFPVRVIGRVGTPGVIELKGNSPYLLSALSTAGGFGLDANKDMVAIRRFSNEGGFSTLYVNPDKMDFVLRPNDVVYVSENKVYKAGRFMDTAAKVLAPFTSLTSIGASGASIFGIGGWQRP